MTVRNITMGDIVTAAKVDDIDAAIAPLQDKAGITDGGVAAVAFSGLDWDTARINTRVVWIVRWVKLEQAYEEMQP